MIDEKKLIESLRASLNTGRETFPIDLIIECIEEQEQIGEWIPCSERLPENEADVLIAFSVGDTKCHIAMAFYEDGTKTTEDSDYWWNDIDNFEYSEKDRCFFIPEGWWESVTFSDEFKPVDREVVAWMPLPEPCKAR